MEIIHHKKSIEKNMTDQPKYLNKNRTLFKCKNHLKVKYTCFMVFWGFKQSRESGPKYTEWDGIYRKD